MHIHNDCQIDEGFRHAFSYTIYTHNFMQSDQGSAVDNWHELDEQGL